MRNRTIFGEGRKHLLAGAVIFFCLIVVCIVAVSLKKDVPPDETCPFMQPKITPGTLSCAELKTFQHDFFEFKRQKSRGDVGE